MIDQHLYPSSAIKKNDRKARIFIITASTIILGAIVSLSRIKLNIQLPFNVHVFALTNAIINSIVTILLLAGLYAVKQRNYLLHRNIMITAILLSVLFLLSYIGHHLFAGETIYGDLDHDGRLSATENLAAGRMRLIYYALLITHIPLAGIILPFVLFTAYRGLTGEYKHHKKLAKITWPLWLYVAISGVLVYILISPYYL